MRIVKGFRAGLRVGRSLAVQCRHAWHVVRGHMIRCVHKAWEVGFRLYPIAGKHARAQQRFLPDGVTTWNTDYDYHFYNLGW